LLTLVTLGRRTRRSSTSDLADPRPAAHEDNLYGSGTALDEPTEVPTAQLTVRRTSPEDVKERELYVSLDDKRIAVLVYGESVTIPITSGPHRIRVHNTLFWKNIEFFAKPGQHIRFRTANVPGKSFVMLAIFIGFALMYTVLEREADGPSFGG
jgi:hypothetical protein